MKARTIRMRTDFWWKLRLLKSYADSNRAIHGEVVLGMKVFWTTRLIFLAGGTVTSMLSSVVG